MNKKASYGDVTRRAFSVLFAIMLWFYVITEQNPVVPKDITVPVKIVNYESLDKKDLIMLENPDSYSITLRIKGKKETLDSIRQSTLTAYADVSTYAVPGENSVPVIINGIPDGVTITSRSDHSIRVTLDKKVSVQKTVEVNITGNPILGLASLNPVVTPTEVVLTGAESVINKVKTVKVDVDIAGVSANVEKRLLIRLLDAEGREVKGVKLDTEYANVVIPISNTKRVPIQLQLEGAIGDGYTIADQFVTPREILVTGEQGLLDSLTVINTKAVSVSGKNASFEVPVSLELPAGVQLANPNEQVRGFVDIQPVVTSTVEISDIGLRNLNERLVVQDSPSRVVRLTLRGPEALIKDLGKNITLYVDLTNAKEGLNSYEVLWEKAPKLEILEMTPQHIGLDIKSRE